MGFFSSKTPEQIEAREALKKARRALDANQAREIRDGIDEETPEFHRLNHALCEAEKNARRTR